jgi:hypothetical protein
MLFLLPLPDRAISSLLLGAEWDAFLLQRGRTEGDYVTSRLGNAVTFLQPGPLVYAILGVGTAKIAE